MATVAAGASSPTAGYDHAFWTSAAAMVIGPAVALAPGKHKPERHVTSSEDIAEPTVLVEA